MPTLSGGLIIPSNYFKYGFVLITFGFESYSYKIEMGVKILI